MSPRTITLSLALLLGFAVASQARAAQIDLRPRFQPGAEAHYISRSIIDHEVRVDEAQIDKRIKVQTESGMTLTVKEVRDDGSALVTWRIRYVALTSDAAVPGIEGALDYDSRDPGKAASPLAPLLSRLIEQPVTVRVDAMGKVIDYQGINTAGLTGPLGALAQGFFSRQALEKLPLFVTAGAPSPARIRSKWSKTSSVDMPLGAGTLELVEDYKFTRISPRREMAHLDMKGTITKGTAGSGMVPGSNLMAAAATLIVEDGTVTAQYLWDYAAGELVSAESQMRLRTTLDTPLGRMNLTQEMSSLLERSTDKKMQLPKEPWDEPSPRKSNQSR